MRVPPLPATLRAYRYGLYLGEPAVAGLLAWRSRRGKEDPHRLPERRGWASRARPVGNLVWMHGASIGEALSLIGLVQSMITRGFSVLVTSGTRSAAELLSTRLPTGAVHQYVPLDTPRWVERFLDHWQPDLALVAESEIWPNTIIALHERGVPLILVNGRMSERSFKGWARTPRTVRALLARIAVCLVQSKADAERFARLGAPRITVTGNLKYDSAMPPADAQQLTYLGDMIRGRPVWLAASTHPGEEAIIVAAHAALKARVPRLLTILVPRHAGRGGEVAEETLTAGLQASRRSQEGRPNPAVEVYVADTFGELGLFYRLCPLVFLGGSLVPHGGQNPIEPVRLQTAILHGPHTANFAESYRALDASGSALMVSDVGELTAAVHDLLSDPGRIDAMAARGQEALRPFEGAVARTLAVLDPFVVQMKLAARYSA